MAVFYRLLSELVEHVDTLIEEWYPGLEEKDPFGGSHLQRLIPCIVCNGKSVITLELMFPLIITCCKLDETIKCFIKHFPSLLYSILK